MSSVDDEYIFLLKGKICYNKEITNEERRSLHDLKNYRAKEVLDMSHGQKMIQFLQDKQLEQATAEFNLALQHDNKEELYLLADSLYELGFLKETRTIDLQLLNADPYNDELKISLAEIAIEEDDVDQAMEWLSQIGETSQAYPQSLMVQADMYFVQGLYEVSEQKLLQAQDILGDEPVIQFALAELHFAMGKDAQAIRGYEALMEKGYTEFSGINLAGRSGNAYSALGDFDEAVLYLEQSVEEDEKTDTLFQLGFTYLQKKDNQRAVETLFQLKELDPSYTSLYPYLAVGLEEENRLEKAAEVIQEGLQYDRYNPDLYLQGANIAIKLENEELAEQYFKEAITLAPDNAVYLLGYANLLLKQERYEETIAMVQAKLKEEVVDPQFYWNLAQANNGLENYEAAGAGYKKAYPSFRQNADFLREYIDYLREEGNRDIIKEVLGDYLVLEPTDEEMVTLLESINGNDE